METRSNTLTGAGVTMGERPRARDVEFSAYMEARQPSLLRTAYLLTGDRHTAEDLVQTALAKLYLAWDKVQRRDSVDGYVRRILVNEHNSLWRRGWKKREHATDEIPESQHTDSVRRGPARRAVGGRADAPPQGAGRGGAPLLRAAVRGRDRRRARHLRRDREVPVQPGAGRPARTRTRDTCTPAAARRSDEHQPRRARAPARRRAARPRRRHRRRPPALRRRPRPRDARSGAAAGSPLGPAWPPSLGDRRTVSRSPAPAARPTRARRSPPPARRPRARAAGR